MNNEGDSLLLIETNKHIWNSFGLWKNFDLTTNIGRSSNWRENYRITLWESYNANKQPEDIELCTIYDVTFFDWNVYE